MAKKLGDVAKKMTEMVSQKPEAEDAIGLLEQDHRDVEQFLDQFEQAEDNQTKQQLARQICLALTVHSEIEEKQFYPAARRQGEEEIGELLDEAEVEHASAKQLIAQIESMTPRDKLFDAKVKVLGEYVKHHVKEEENELFPKVRDTDMDLVGMGKKLKELKMSLLKQTAGRG
jgi:hemerythrin superfamily protein